jgi:hypothetical protein
MNDPIKYIYLATVFRNLVNNKEKQMSKKLITLFTTLLIALPKIYATETLVQKSDQLIQPRMLGLVEYAHDRKDSDNNDPIISRFEDEDNAFLSRDGWVYIQKKAGAKHLLRGLRYGMSGVDEEGKPKMIQSTTFSYMRFGCVCDSRTSLLTKKLTVWCSGSRILAKDETGAELPEYFFVSKKDLEYSISEAKFWSKIRSAPSQ